MQNQWKKQKKQQSKRIKLADAPDTMVTCNFDSIKKMDRPRRNTTSSSNSSGFRLLDDHCDTVSSVSRNSIYKLKIDAMFDDTR